MDNIKIPRHIAVIMDGNGRWAAKRGLPRKAGHVEGANRLDEIVESCARLKVAHLTVYALSTENLKERPADEINALLKLFIRYVAKEKKKLIENRIKVKIIGDKTPFSKDVLKAIAELESYTAGGDGMMFFIALNYGGRAEILQAVKRYVEEAKKGAELSFCDQEFSGFLYTENVPDPDLLIRTGGDLRVSNFLLYQAAYAELYFTPTLWPDFTEECLIKALESFSERKRRYGGV